MIIKPKKIKEITIPPSKSYMHRALIGAFLCKEKCNITNIYHSQDIDTTLNALKSLKRNDIINCGECASTLRFLIPVSLIINKGGGFSFDESLGKRPLDEYFNIFDKKKIKYSKDKHNLIVRGELKSGVFNLRGDVSSQFLTGLCFALPLLKRKSEIHIEKEPQSLPYIDITLKVLKDFGIEIENHNYKTFTIKGNQEYKCKEYTCEGDWSTGAFWYFLSQKYDIKINNLNLNSLQPDSAVTKITPHLPEIFDAKNSPDLVPLLAAYAICTHQSIKIINCQRLKYKESNRLEALKEFQKTGANINITDNTITIKESDFSAPKSMLLSYNDHRIVMAYALFSFLTNTKIETDNINCLNKSYPELTDIIKS